MTLSLKEILQMSTTAKEHQVLACQKPFARNCVRKVVAKILKTLVNIIPILNAIKCQNHHISYIKMFRTTSRFSS